MKQKEKCPFCEIDHNKTRLIVNKKNTFVAFSNPSLMPYHLLVVPKRHVEKLSQLKKEEQKELFDTIIEFQEKILSKVANGCDIRQHYRPFQKQTNLKIYHLHVHLQPRELEDELYKKSQIFETKIFKNLDITKIKETLLK